MHRWMPICFRCVGRRVAGGIGMAAACDVQLAVVFGRGVVRIGAGAQCDHHRCASGRDAAGRAMVAGLRRSGVPVSLYLPGHCRLSLAALEGTAACVGAARACCCHNAGAAHSAAPGKRVSVLLLLALNFSGFAALCLAMDTHRQALHGRVSGAARSRQLRVLGWFLLVLTFGLAVQAQGWGHRTGAVAGHVDSSCSAAVAVAVAVSTWRDRAGCVGRAGAGGCGAGADWLKVSSGQSTVHCVRLHVYRRRRSG